MSDKPMAAEPLREWTIMFYFASDNALAPSTVSQLKAIKDAGFHPEANVIARFDPHTENTPTHIFDVNRIAKLKYPNGSRVGFENDPYVRNLVLDKLWGNVEKGDKEIRAKIKEALDKGKKKGKKRDDDNGFEMQVLPEELSVEGSPRDSLKAFLNFCRDQYPAKRFVLFILGHGVVVGNDLFLFDEHIDGPRPATNAASGTPPPEGNEDNARPGTAPRSAEELEGLSRNSLSLKGVSDVLRTFKRELSKESEFELIGFHSCSMSGLEVAYELRDTANYMLASQGPAYVGSWPYKQILMRIFGDLNSPLLSVGDLMNGGLVARLKDGADEATTYLRGKLSPPTLKLLEDKADPRHPGLGLVRSLKRDLNEMLKEGIFLKEGTPFKAEPGPPAVSGNGNGNGRGRRETDVQRAGRERLLARLSELKERRQIHPRDVKDLLTTLFYYILYNSYDFQLAGYSFDLCLCDLKKVDGVTKAVRSLAKALKAGLGDKPGLAGGGTTMARELILLSHWDAQSFWQESYTDLYDFCFRLKRRCLHVSPELEVLDKSWDEAGEPADAPPGGPTGVLADIVTACRRVMHKLERGTEGYDDGVIVGADFTGAEYQYSHGLSVFFPWSRPVNGFFDKTYFYKEPEADSDKARKTESDKERQTRYEFSNETGWGDFLDQYFKKTMRETSTEENIAVSKPSRGTRAPAEDIDDEPDEGRNDKIEREVLEELLKRVGIRVFSEGQLAKGGSDDKTDSPGINKGGSDDKTGSDFPLIKNYPPITGKSSEEAAEESDCVQWQSRSYGPTFEQGLWKSKR